MVEKPPNGGLVRPRFVDGPSVGIAWAFLNKRPWTVPAWIFVIDVVVGWIIVRLVRLMMMDGV